MGFPYEPDQKKWLVDGYNDGWLLVYILGRWGGGIVQHTFNGHPATSEELGGMRCVFIDATSARLASEICSVGFPA